MLVQTSWLGLNGYAEQRGMRTLAEAGNQYLNYSPALASELRAWDDNENTQANTSDTDQNQEAMSATLQEALTYTDKHAYAAGWLLVGKMFNAQGELSYDLPFSE